MKRYPAYDPPEYANWQPEPGVMAEFRARLAADGERAEIIAGLDAPGHIALLSGLYRARLHDIALKRWVKQGVISKAWLGTGEEAATIGAVRALEPGDHVGPMIRNAGACHEMGMPVADMLRAYLGTYDTITRGRDLHTGDLERGVVPPVSMVASLVPVFAGIALAFKKQGRASVALTWVGDGSTRTAEFHEGAMLASRLRVPAIYIIQNNQVALGTELKAGVAGDLRRLHEAYGAAGLTCDGNNVLDVFAATRLAAAECRRGNGPVFLTAETFRLGGHATHDEAEARGTFAASLFEHWGRRDPVGMYETWLVESGPALAAEEPGSTMAAGIELESDVAGAEAAFPAERGSARLRERTDPQKAGAPGGQTDPGRVNSAKAMERNRSVVAALEERIVAEVEAAAEEALKSRGSAQPPPESVLEGVYALPTRPTTG